MAGDRVDDDDEDDWWGVGWRRGQGTGCRLFVGRQTGHSMYRHRKGGGGQEIHIKGCRDRGRIKYGRNYACAAAAAAPPTPHTHTQAPTSKYSAKSSTEPGVRCRRDVAACTLVMNL